MLPFDQRTGKIWYDGTLVDWADARLHVLSHGLHYASSIFEGIRVYGGTPFLLKEHIARLGSSARVLDFALEYGDDELYEATLAVVAEAGITEGYVRMNAWRGSEIIQTAALKTSIHTSVAAWELPEGYYAAADALEKGISLVTGRYRRPSPEFAPVKSKAAGNYMIGTVSKNEALRAGFDDALLLDDRGNFVEATGAHLFFTKDGALHTPTTRCTIEGLTRACVLAIAEREGIDCTVGDLPPEFAGEADGAFLCGTACEILPVARIDDHYYALGGNDVLRRIVTGYRELTEGRAEMRIR
ncbi:branched-chain amino acid aminotransferase [Streptomyces davaonensis JCM 4913]|uniref:Branched-chain amino acid aminotransferase n=1 Tax=Streptomyces davaonensis (strain DSM 101723 / JCM 4913 / KCC S-0913 / 768) TaxID=1214101 RepID=K4RCP8_STRDJ|nr:aminotransferase class IV [Streptomyces davaonensis]CCK31140.1 branched-chain amino acid aminotransferase [Streptomyces davaonensis JCM 4913]